jgi:hypothetical protein
MIWFINGLDGQAMIVSSVDYESSSTLSLSLISIYSFFSISTKEITFYLLYLGSLSVNVSTTYPLPEKKRKKSGSCSIRDLRFELGMLILLLYVSHYI